MLYSSFLVRVWLHREEDGYRPASVVVEHIQTGEQVRTATVGEVAPWIERVMERLPLPAAEEGQE